MIGKEISEEMCAFHSHTTGYTTSTIEFTKKGVSHYHIPSLTCVCEIRGGVRQDLGTVVDGIVTARWPLASVSGRCLDKAMVTAFSPLSVQDR